tara:strand:+ start:166 stop:768 length:603 start_codon:yes stop_codon:yes gene_type:complete
MNKFYAFFALVFLTACGSTSTEPKSINLVEFDCSNEVEVQITTLMQSEEFNVDSWVCSIRALDPDYQDIWYSNLLARLSSIAQDTGDIDVGVWFTIIKEINPDYHDIWYSNLLSGLSSIAQDTGDIDVGAWLAIIKELNPEYHDIWYGNLLSMLFSIASGGGEYDKELMKSIIDKISDEELQEIWRVNLSTLKIYRNIPK